jgi:hypothetical protein
MSEVPTFFPVGGGLDMVSPAISAPAGRLLAVRNYEPAADGYRRPDGFERVDGQPKPSAATYRILHFVDGTADLAVGDIVTGTTSGATGKVLVEPEVESGTFGGNDAAGYVVLTAVDGDFIDGEPAGFATVDGEILTFAPTDALHIEWLGLAIETARALIQKPPGSGPVRGTITYQGTKYAFRNSVDGLSGRLFGSSATGWQEKHLGWSIDFTSGGTYWELPYTSGGTYEILPGDTVTGATSTETAVVESLTLTSGTWAGGDAAGTLTLVSQSGDFVAENLNVGANNDVATIAGNSTINNEGGELLDGDQIAGATASAEIGRVILESGAWEAGTAAGRLILKHPITTAPFGAEAIDNDTLTDIAVVAGPETAVTLPPGGHYDMFMHNFYGASDLERVYGANGVGNGFEWDGEVMVLVETGMENDKPTHAWEFSNQLFFSFPGGSIQNSSIGLPLNHEPVLGAAEIGVGADVTGALSFDTACVIFAKGKISVLTGHDREDFVLTTLTGKAGGMEWSMQQAIRGIYLDAAGLRDVSATQTFANFRAGQVSELIFPALQAKAKRGEIPVASMVVPSKNLYRLFFSDGSGLNVYLGKKFAESTVFDYGITTFCASCDYDEVLAEEVALVGTDDGWVYQLDSGTTFDAEPLEGYFMLVFNHCGSPHLNKVFSGGMLEINAMAPITLMLSAIFDYGDPNQRADSDNALTSSGGGGLWDEAEWESFVWDAPIKGQAAFDLAGFGANVSYRVSHESRYEQPHTITGLWIYAKPRGMKKRVVA